MCSVGIVKTGRMYSCEDRCEVTCEYEGHDQMGEGECPGDNRLLCYSGHCWLVFTYYSTIVLSLVMSLFNFCICSFLAIYGYGYALRGQDGSFVAHAIAVFLKYRKETLDTFVWSVVFLIFSVNLLAFVKVGLLAVAAVTLFSVLILGGLCKGLAIFQLMRVRCNGIGRCIKRGLSDFSREVP